FLAIARRHWIAALDQTGPGLCPVLAWETGVTRRLLGPDELTAATAEASLTPSARRRRARARTGTRASRSETFSDRAAPSRAARVARGPSARTRRCSSRRIPSTRRPSRRRAGSRRGARRRTISADAA